MGVSDKKLQAGIEMVTNEDMKRLDEEMKNVEPHTFSDEFEKKMDTLLQSSAPKAKRKTIRISGHVAVAAAVVLMVGGLGIASGAKLYASETKMPILQWMGNFFVTEHDTDQMKGEKSNEVLFQQEQIGYLPEGFELIQETSRHSRVSYVYKNSTNEYIRLSVCEDKSVLGIDIDKKTPDVSVSASGLEYRYAYKTDSKEHTFFWTDENEYVYYLSGSIEKEELINIMDSISY